MQNKVIEMREYNTKFGIWYYYIAEDFFQTKSLIEIAKKDNLETYEKVNLGLKKLQIKFDKKNKF